MRIQLAITLLIASGCNSLAAPLDYSALPWVSGYASDSRAGACGDLASQWRQVADAIETEPTRTFYVRPRGDDDASGETPEQAWRSLARVNAQVLQPGDRVLLEGGVDHPGSLRLEREDSGTQLAPVTIGSFGEGRARIEASAGTAIEIANAQGIVLRGLILHGGWNAEVQHGNGGFGVRAQNTLGGGTRLRLVRLLELEISGFREAGIALNADPADGSKGSGFEGVEIADCDVHDNGDVGVVSGGPFIAGSGYSHHGLLVHHTRVHHNRGLRGKGEHTGSGIVLADVDGAAIERCVAHDNGEFNDSSAGGGFGIWVWDSNAIVIQHNESYRNMSQTADGGGFDLDGGTTHSALQYNYSHDNHGAGFGAFQFGGARPHGANLIRYNISQNDGAGFILWDENGDLSELAIHNNVSYGAPPSLVTYSGLDSVRLLHNVFYATGASLLQVSDGAGLTLRGNAYFSAQAPFNISWNSATSGRAEYDSLAAFRAATDQERSDGVATGLQEDPRLIAAGGGGTLDDAERLGTLDAYQLADDSPLIDRGLDLSDYDLEPGCLDFFGNPIPRGPLDIGVHERQ